MAVTPANLLAGPATLYTGAFGATEPADSAVNTVPASATWTDLGGTQDGTTVNIDTEFLELEVDQVIDIPARRLTKRDIQVQTNLAEPTLNNLNLVLNSGTQASSAAYATYEPLDGAVATQLVYKALLLDGFAPTASTALNRRIIFRKVASIEGIETAYKKDEQTLFPVTFGCHYVSAAVRPFKVIDQLT